MCFLLQIDSEIRRKFCCPEQRPPEDGGCSRKLAISLAPPFFLTLGENIVFISFHKTRLSKHNKASKKEKKTIFKIKLIFQFASSLNTDI